MQDEMHGESMVRDQFNLDGKVAVVTGAAGLLGKAHIHALAAAGANVVLVDLESDVCAERAEKLIREFGGNHKHFACDVTDLSQWQLLREKIRKHFNRIDILLNNAGYTNRTKSKTYGNQFSEFPLETWHAIMDVNLTGVFLGCRVIGSEMVKAGAGSIINIASLYGVVSPNHNIYPETGISQPVAYSVSKAGVIALTRYLATLWGKTGVRVNALTPGGIYDGQNSTFVNRFNALNPMGRMGTPAELQGALLFLASDASQYCTGHNLVVDGGWTVW